MQRLACPAQIPVAGNRAPASSLHGSARGKGLQTWRPRPFQVPGRRRRNRAQERCPSLAPRIEGIGARALGIGDVSGVALDFVQDRKRCLCRPVHEGREGPGDGGKRDEGKPACATGRVSCGSQPQTKKAMTRAQPVVFKVTALALPRMQKGRVATGAEPARRQLRLFGLPPAMLVKGRPASTTAGLNGRQERQAVPLSARRNHRDRRLRQTEA